MGRWVERGWFRTHSSWVCKCMQLHLCKWHACAPTLAQVELCVLVQPGSKLVTARYRVTTQGLRTPALKCSSCLKTDWGLFFFGFLHNSSSHHWVWRSWVPGPWTPWTGRRWLLKRQGDPDGRSKQDVESSLQHPGRFSSVWNWLLPKESSPQV